MTKKGAACQKLPYLLPPWLSTRRARCMTFRPANHSDRYKRCWMIHYFITQFPPTWTWIRDLSEIYKMSDINATRLPNEEKFGDPYVGGRDSTLTRGDRWAPSCSTPIRWYTYVLCINISLCWMLNITLDARSASPLLWHEGVVISLDAYARQLYWPRLVVDSGRYKLLTILGLER